MGTKTSTRSTSLVPLDVRRGDASLLSQRAGPVPPGEKGQEEKQPVGDSWAAAEVHCFPASSASQDQCANHADGKLQPIAEHVHHKRAAEDESKHVDGRGGPPWIASG